MGVGRSAIPINSSAWLSRPKQGVLRLCTSCSTSAAWCGARCRSRFGSARLARPDAGAHQQPVPAHGMGPHAGGHTRGRIDRERRRRNRREEPCDSPPVLRIGGGRVSSVHHHMACPWSRDLIRAQVAGAFQALHALIRIQPLTHPLGSEMLCQWTLRC